MIEPCSNCGNASDIAVARNMRGTRHCAKCHHTWDPKPLGAPVSQPAVRPEFAVHMLNEQGKVKARYIAEDFSRLLTSLDSYIGNGREAAIVRTKLEEACFFAKKGMAVQRENQTV
jgi:hypothetical protein